MDSSQQEMRSNEKISIQRSELFIILKDLLNNELTKTLEVVENYVSKKANRKYYLSEEEKKSVSYLLYRFRTLWKESARTESRFRAKNQEWLNGSIVFNDQKASTAAAILFSRKILSHLNSAPQKPPSKDF
ncbi:PREDICTED: uncharacterized protein LOC108745885 [Trachymyrmex septentrionalis]|uniref:uncharacterized protein LOC108745885 n=1 Tax=Trachymyrmex septentrionalis TaxID=34720 RepID=UPI00084F2016|nr:PREDICTED: uncharacterized protein LOC108745885 [Trachymyrmex septentrionalis]